MHGTIAVTFKLEVSYPEDVGRSPNPENRKGHKNQVTSSTTVESPNQVIIDQILEEEQIPTNRPVPYSPLQTETEPDWVLIQKNYIILHGILQQHKEKREISPRNLDPPMANRDKTSCSMRPMVTMENGSMEKKHPLSQTLKSNNVHPSKAFGRTEVTEDPWYWSSEILE
ncbi:hypothetical protein FRC14_003148 [Serendipita sp. 396]|nr:hypothetical protein FRC14_003148 [Serendipita sp. 396]KAG8774529.1 hypothetical protein FRC15_001220 [Serendipita sp. 397]KAG8831249.1 hypothetical protein FRC18_006890 [Serendipita sp. 400]KAG8850712.1 hypothetical protein FRB91_008844 [Serendipita sp. 411]